MDLKGGKPHDLTQLAISIYESLQVAITQKKDVIAVPIIDFSFEYNIRTNKVKPVFKQDPEYPGVSIRIADKDSGAYINTVIQPAIHLALKIHLLAKLKTDSGYAERLNFFDPKKNVDEKAINHFLDRIFPHAEKSVLGKASLFSQSSTLKITSLADVDKMLESLKKSEVPMPRP